MTSIAAILTIVGYSLNETVVVFDRTRELMRRYKTIPTVELLNLSINSTMSRTVMTATSAFLSLLALVLFGGEAIQGFASGDAGGRGHLHLLGDLRLDTGPDLSRPDAVGREIPERAPPAVACPRRRSRERWRPPAACTTVSFQGAISSTPTATAASALPTCRIVAPSW